ncbi:MAG: rod shape determining protein RodA [Rickettsiales bacterium]|jgi:rod shape determining protein RodA
MLFYFEKDKTILEKVFALNWRFICLILLLAFIGFAMQYSAAGGNFNPWLTKQLIFFIVFFPIMIFIAITDIRFWLQTAYFYYAIALVLLIAVAIMGHNAMGATRWFRIGGIAIQPSEIMKVCLVFSLAKYFYSIDADKIGQIKYIIIPIIMILAPALLVFNQPDLGTAIIMLLVGISILFLAGVRMWKFILAGVSVLIAVPFLWIFMLYDYQKERILNFLNPDNDPLGTGYNIIQSKIAIGSGGIFGKGYLGGTQGQLEFLPEKQTDFIFTMLAEELGMFGSLFTIFSYALMIYLGTRIAMKSKHQYGRLLVFGIINILFIHVFVNMGMVMGLLPVVGAPLPLISYGGTITATMLIGFGLLLNIDANTDMEDMNN